MSGMFAVTEQLARAAEEVAGIPAALDRLEPQPFAEFATVPGRLGQLGQDLRTQLADAFEFRREEAADAGAGLTALADALRSAANTYAEAEDHTRERTGRVRDGDL